MNELNEKQLKQLTDKEEIDDSYEDVIQYYGFEDEFTQSDYENSLKVFFSQSLDQRKVDILELEEMFFKIDDDSQKEENQLIDKFSEKQNDQNIDKVFNEKLNNEENQIQSQISQDDIQIIKVNKPKNMFIDDLTGTIFEGIDFGKIKEKCENADNKLEQDTIIDIEEEEELQYKYDPIKTFQYEGKGRRKLEKKWDLKKNHFVCVKGSEGIETFNQKIIDEFEKLLKFYEIQQDKGRILAYRKAISVIRAIKKPIKNTEDVENLFGLGQKCKDKIKEILRTGELQKAHQVTNDQKFKQISELTQIWGVGPQHAQKLIDQGITSVSELRKNLHKVKLSYQQLIGLNRYEDLLEKIPREEADKIINQVFEEIELISDIPNIYKATCCGSYRRGKSMLGDIDIIITRQDEKPFHGFLEQLVSNLVKKQLITDQLVQVIKPNKYGSETFMGVCRLQDPNNKFRRIDIKIYPKSQYGFALLYFTGSGNFNRSMRLLANKKGYSLSDHGLFLAERNRAQKVWTSTQSIQCFDEKSVFEFLKIPYKRPEERNV